MLHRCDRRRAGSCRAVPFQRRGGWQLQRRGECQRRDQCHLQPEDRSSCRAVPFIARLRDPTFRRSMRPGGRATPSHAPQAEAARSLFPAPAACRCPARRSRCARSSCRAVPFQRRGGWQLQRRGECQRRDQCHLQPEDRSSCRAVPFRRRDGPEDERQPQLSARAPLCGQALGKLAGVAEPAPRAEPFASFLSQVCFDRACAMGTIGCDPWAASARSSVQKGSQTLPRRPVRRSRSWQHCNSEQL